MNNIFAHYVYGIPVEYDEATINSLAKLADAECCDLDEFEDLADGERTLADMRVWRNSLLVELRTKFKITSKAVWLYVVEADAYRGSESSPGDCFFGVGVLQFPVTDAQLAADIATLTSVGADWHSWVT